MPAQRIVKNNGSGLCVIILLNNGMMSYVFRENL